MDFEYKSDLDLFEFIMVSELKVLNSTNESCTVEANSYTVGYSHFINKQRGTLVKVTLAATTDLASHAVVFRGVVFHLLPTNEGTFLSHCLTSEMFKPITDKS